MILFIITLIVILQIIPILYYTYNSAISKNNHSLYLAVVIPDEHKNHPEVQAIFQAYRQKIRKITLFCLIISVLSCCLLLVPVFSDYILTFVMIIFIATYLPLRLYNQAVYHYRRKLLDLKAQNSWQAATEQILFADLTTSRLKNQRTPKSWLFAIPALLSLGIYLTFDKNIGMLILLITNLLMHLLFWLAHYNISHMPAKIYTDNSQTNLVLNQEYRRNWTFNYLILSFIQTGLMFLLSFLHLRFVHDPSSLMTGYFITILLLMAILPIIVIFYANSRQQKKEKEFLRNQHSLIHLEEDSYYQEHGIWGLQYNNPNNSSTLVNKPFGIGQAVNLGSQKGRAYFAFSKWLLALILIFSIGLVCFEDYLAPAIQVTEQGITIYQSLYPIQVSAENIESIEYHEEFTKQHFYKNVGSATNRYLRGTFSAKGDPDVRLYLFRNQPYILFHLKDMAPAKLYYNDQNPAETIALYDKIKQKLPDKVNSSAVTKLPATAENGSASRESTEIHQQRRQSFTAAEIDYSIPAGKGSLHAVLNIPDDRPDKAPLVLLIGGSGPATKEGLANLYLDLAIHLNDAGIACIRYDKRGIARSASVVDAKTEEKNMVIEDFVADVIALLQKARTDNRFSGIYIAGHSEGALVGTLAAQTVAIDGLVCLAGAGRNIAEITLEQIKANPNNPQKLVDDSQRILNSLKAGQETEDVPQILQALFRPSVQPYMISWIKYDPAAELAKLNDTPILILQGDNDSQVQIIDADNLHQAVADSKIVILPEMTHMLKNSDIRKEDAFKNNLAALTYSRVYQDENLPINASLLREIISFILSEK
ncbi:hypothetical protein EII17_05815 [Clostridiales bacterium COT073_COT-073]|nr:hypothetical protein EII17_05815 [Clostridiales bacterium COT073_COT-073]